LTRELQEVRALYGALLSPDATVFAHLIDDGGYPRAVQRLCAGDGRVRQVM
jgi:hypothetical protein